MENQSTDNISYLTQELKKTKFTKNLAITSNCISSIMVGINIVLVLKNHQVNQDLTFAGVTGIVLYTICICANSYVLMNVNNKYKETQNKINKIKQ